MPSKILYFYDTKFIHILRVAKKINLTILFVQKTTKCMCNCLYSICLNDIIVKLNLIFCHDSRNINTIKKECYGKFNAFLHYSCSIKHLHCFVQSCFAAVYRILYEKTNYRKSTLLLVFHVIGCQLCCCVFAHKSLINELVFTQDFCCWHSGCL